MATLPPEGAPPEFDRCLVQEKLHAGPVTYLYRAEQLPLGRPVLIKALSPTVLPSSPFAATLEREAQLLSELEHEGIIRLYDFSRREDTMWLVLEDVHGPTLSELSARAGQVQPMAAAAIGLQIARALEHAHDRDIVHRNVQPDNIRIALDGSVKLMNFSVASDQRLPTAPELLEGDSGFGAPSYMSPEQVLGEPADPRSDLFSLGVILYELLSGRRPFDAPDSRAATQRIRHDPPPPLGRIPDLPRALERIVLRCLEKMPSDRFYSAGELAQALASLVSDTAGEPPARVTLEELARLGFAEQPARRDTARRRAASSVVRAPTLGQAFRGYVACLIALVAGAGVIQYADAKNRAENPRSRSARLELLPAKRAFLRVVADPWATVIVDGQEVDTTPFARPVPLSAGVHYVRLEHPDAPTERRTLRLAPGETVLLDVEMEVNPKAKAPKKPNLPPQVPRTETP